MAQFRAVIQGQRGQASRLGSKKSGASAVVNGWRVGVRVNAYHEAGRDVIEVYATGGSNGTGFQSTEPLVRLRSDDGRVVATLDGGHTILIGQ